MRSTLVCRNSTRVCEADNFTNEDLPKLMSYLHEHGVRGFVTMNTLIFAGELPRAETQLLHMEACGVDAIIVQDLGIADLASRIAPKLELACLDPDDHQLA